MTTLRAFAADMALMFRLFGRDVATAARDMAADVRETFRRG